MLDRRLAALLILPVLFGCKGKAVDPLQESYRALRSVPRERWDRLAGKKIFFGHHSVGRNILSGLEDVMRAEPSVRLVLRETSDPRDFGGPVFAHATVGRNGDPAGKIDEFRRLLDGGLGQAADIAFFKLCFVDVGRASDIDAILDHYDRTLAGLGARYPGLRIIPVTVPLTNQARGIKARIKRLLGRGPAVRADNARRNALNRRIRERYGAAVWDLAGAEAGAGAGPEAASDGEGESLALLNPAFTTDGGHLNAVGRQVVAIDLLLHLASLDLR
ncbi:MAG TPA: hypothetical protein P5119_06095 [Candidatus Aminicenantes bacterium]|nr:hypothetical protein [Candidatus Aminicenantes bacterium]HRY64896.1 hypothetical protein [Candidatus Aminicenantes bacterium]HRZ71809.1 hypothetical protein [Candidatus Aminicenantes bacterium]